MFSNYTGLAGPSHGFSKGGSQGIKPVAVPPSAAPGSWQREKQILEMKQKHEMDLMRMRLEMAKLQRSGVSVPAAMQRAVAQTTSVVKTVTPGTSTAAAIAVTADVAKLKAQIEALKRKETVAKQGGGVTGSGGKSVREVLTGGAQDTDSKQKWMRSTAKKGLAWDDWRKLKLRLPANFNETKYLTNNPDIAAAVKRGQFPSGAWHYVMYGSPNCISKERHGRSCDKKARSFSGFRGIRRPGYLSGIFANWSQF